MKKTLFSLAFLATSAAYVAYANHALDSVLPAAARPGETVAAPLAPATTAASASPALLDPAPAASTIAPIVALAIPSTPPQAPPAPTPAAVAPTMPPLPRPRPTDGPTVQTAQSAVTATGSSPYRDGTYAGTDENAYYGRVQVQVTIAGNQITSVKALDYPSDRRASRYINSQALPMLRQEVMQAQNANVDTVSGATLTSDAYIKSLDNALNKAAGGNA